MVVTVPFGLVTEDVVSLDALDPPDPPPLPDAALAPDVEAAELGGGVGAVLAPTLLQGLMLVMARASK